MAARLKIITGIHVKQVFQIFLPELLYLQPVKDNLTYENHLRFIQGPGLDVIAIAIPSPVFIFSDAPVFFETRDQVQKESY